MKIAPPVRPATTTGAETAPPAALPLAAPVVACDRMQVARAAQDRMLADVRRLKDRSAKAAMSGFGQGDAGATERRSAVHVLLKAPTELAVADMLKSLSTEVARDVAFIKDVEMREYRVGGNQPFSWYGPYANGTVTADALHQELRLRTTAQTNLAAEVRNGTKAFFDASSLSVLGLSLLRSPILQADALMDTLLQYRARSDASKQSTDANRTRIDRFGLVMLAEQRMLLGAAPTTTTEPGEACAWALLRLVLASHPISSTNGIYRARNAVSFVLTDAGRFNGRDASGASPTKWIRFEQPEGATAPAYTAIHHNFSRDTQRNVARVVEAWLLPLGEAAGRGDAFVALVEAMEAARRHEPTLLARHGAAVRSALEHIASSVPERAEVLAALLEPCAEGKPAACDAFADAVSAFLQQQAQRPLGSSPEQVLSACAEMYTSVVAQQPTIAMLEDNLFHAGGAYGEVCDVIAAAARGEPLPIADALSKARAALAHEMLKSTSGYARNELLRFDAQLGRMMNEVLGDIVAGVGKLDTDAQRATAFVAVAAALRATMAAGLSSIASSADRLKAPEEEMQAVLASMDAAVANGSIGLDVYRQLMADAHVAVVRCVHNIRAFADLRSARVATGGAVIDPEFRDQLIKETPLHYATALTEAGMRVGLKQIVTDDLIENVEGMRVLNSIGPVVFRDVVVAATYDDLAELNLTKDQLPVVYAVKDEKRLKMGAIAGLILDAADAPGGNSHLNMMAMNNGVPVMALPELRETCARFFANAKSEGGVFIDTTRGFVMATVKKARSLGLVGPNEGDLDALRAGVNRRIHYLRPSDDGRAFSEVASHDAIINPNRPTREVELYVPAMAVRGVSSGVPTFAALAPLSTHARHLAGEKGSVLAILSQHPTLGKHVPLGAVMTPADIAGLRTAAAGRPGETLEDAWQSVWTKDPSVGVVDDRNFLASAFYSSASYRERVRTDLLKLTRTALGKHLLDDGATPSLTTAGQQLYAQMMRDPALSSGKTGSIIARSSYMGEDRPGKSGAGQYESYVDRVLAEEMLGKDAVDASFAAYRKGLASEDAAVREAAVSRHNTFMGPARVAAVMGVIESMWLKEPVENNVAEQFFLKHMGPTVLLQACIERPTFSCVAVSRDLSTGARGAVEVQLVEGFGGGVSGGKVTSCVITKSGIKPSGDASLVTEGLQLAGREGAPAVVVDVATLQRLRELVLETEAVFMQTIEPGKGHAVDMELAFDGDWHIVQARVILVDT